MDGGVIEGTLTGLPVMNVPAGATRITELAGPRPITFEYIYAKARAAGCEFTSPLLLVWERLVTKLEPGATRMHIDSLLSELVAEMLNSRFRK